MNETFGAFLGDPLPSFVRPLAIVAAATVNAACTVLEGYVLVPASDSSKARILADRRAYKIDLSQIPPEVVSFESIFAEGVDLCETKVDLEFFSQLEWGKRAALIGPRYQFHRAEPHRIFRYKWHYGFGPHLKRIAKVTFSPSLRSYLEMIERVQMLPPESKDPLEEDPQ